MMMLDTNVVSELMRPSPNAAVERWLGDAPVAELVTTAITVAEIEFGLQRLMPGTRSRQLREAASRIWTRFRESILPFDEGAAQVYGDVMAASEAVGRPMSALDGQIAAIARQHDALLVTRNVRDFENAGVRLCNPWSVG